MTSQPWYMTWSNNQYKKIGLNFKHILQDLSKSVLYVPRYKPKKNWQTDTQTDRQTVRQTDIKFRGPPSLNNGGMNYFIGWDKQTDSCLHWIRSIPMHFVRNLSCSESGVSQEKHRKQPWQDADTPRALVLRHGTPRILLIYSTMYSGDYTSSLIRQL